MKPLPHWGSPMRRGGVTLVELVVAVGIVALLSSLTLLLLTVGHRAAENVTNQVAAVNPKAATPKRRPNNMALKPSLPVANQYLVVFNKSVTNPQAEANRLAQTVPATVLHVYNAAIKGCALRIQPGQLPALQADASVAYVGQNQTRYLATVLPTGISRVRYVNAPSTPPFKLLFPTLPKYAPLGSGSGGGVINLPQPPLPGTATTPTIKAVAVIDTGCDPTHPELYVVYHNGFGAGVPTVGDDVGHGTHVGGIIGARGVKIWGMFPGVPIWSLRVFPPAPAPGQEPSTTDADVIAGIDFVTQNANQVSAVNMSLGGQGVDPALNAAVTACVNAGVVCCVAAGNSSADASTFSPASAPGAICVAAMCDTDGLPGGYGLPGSFGDPDDTFASFSNYGPTCAVIAPGEDILSTYPVAMGSYAVLSGTSMATPHTTGMSALILGNYSESKISGSGGSTNGLINIPGGGGTGGSTIKQPIASSPAQVLAWLLSESVETIPGLAANNNDTRKYPMITGRP